MIIINKNDKTYELNSLKHIVHKNNLENIFKFGLLSHNEVYRNGLLIEDISMQEIQERRHLKMIPNAIYFLHDCASLYFNNKNPMLYKRYQLQNDLLILLIKPEIILNNNVYFTDGNASAKNTNFYCKKEELINLDLELLNSLNWFNNDSNIQKQNKRKMCAEVLVFPKVEIQHIFKIICYNQEVLEFMNKIKNNTNYNNSCSHIELELNNSKLFYF